MEALSHPEKSAVLGRSLLAAAEELHVSKAEVGAIRVTDDLVEQQMLEEMLGDNKPGSLNERIHDLLPTPFLYPSLDYGSLFGTTRDRWIFYGSLDRETCLGECSY